MNNIIRTFRSDAAINGTVSERRVDANDLAYFANELTGYDPIHYNELRCTLTAFDVFPIKDAAKHLQAYVYDMFTGFGKAKYEAAENGKTSEHAYVGVSGNQHTVVLRSLTSAMAFSDYDILASQAIRRDVIGQLQKQALRTNLELMNQTCFFGDSALGLQGLLSNKFVPAATAVASGKDWTKTVGGTATAAIMYADLLANYNKILNLSKNLLRPNLLLISPAMFNVINSTVFNTFNGITVRQQLETAQQVKVVVTPEFSGTFTSSTSTLNKDGYVFLNNDSEFMEHVVPTLFEVRPPVAQATSLEYISLCQSRHGGLIIRQPNAVSIAYNGNA